MLLHVDYPPTLAWSSTQPSGPIRGTYTPSAHPEPGDTAVPCHAPLLPNRQPLRLPLPHVLLGRLPLRPVIVEPSNSLPPPPPPSGPRQGSGEGSARRDPAPACPTAPTSRPRAPGPSTDPSHLGASLPQVAGTVAAERRRSCGSSYNAGRALAAPGEAG